MDNLCAQKQSSKEQIFRKTFVLGQ